VCAPGRAATVAGVSWAARAVLAAAASLLVACGGGAGATSPPRRAGASDLAAGRRLFLAERCGACHALATVGAHGGSGPDFDASERLTRAQLRAALAEGANGMPSYAGRLVPRQLDALVAFLYAATHARSRG
jgi:mono/diheme cytochrome c family protein